MWNYNFFLSTTTFHVLKNITTLSFDDRQWKKNDIVKATKPNDISLRFFCWFYGKIESLFIFFFYRVLQYRQPQNMSNCNFCVQWNRAGIEFHIVICSTDEIIHCLGVCCLRTIIMVVLWHILSIRRRHFCTFNPPQSGLDNIVMGHELRICRQFLNANRSEKWSEQTTSVWRQRCQ